jgi:Ser/Thr protein kinase RdoA (MazF antagonist)
MTWTDSDAHRAATIMCALAGLQDSELELLRFGSNAVFGIGRTHVIRVMRPTTSPADVQREIDLVREFVRLNVPAVRLADVPVQQPLKAMNCLGTVWERLLEEPDHRNLYRPLGQLIQLFHQRTVDLRVPLEPWHQLASSDRRLAELHSHYSPQDVAMLTRWSRRISTALDQVEPMLPGGVIHGQAEVGNVLFRAGQPVLIDFEQVALGHVNGILSILRSWSLVSAGRNSATATSPMPMALISGPGMATRLTVDSGSCAPPPGSCSMATVAAR